MPRQCIQLLIDTIRSNYHVSRNAEITIECNPEDMTPEFIGALPAMGFNRLSIGIQSFDDNILRFLNRRHDARRAIEAVNTARAIGFDNISIDLMFGIPGQTETILKQDLEVATSLPVTHLSSYCLSYEKGTSMHAMLQNGKIQETDEDTLNRYYDIICEQCDKTGFKQYETSNFARSTFRSRHNSGYWDGTPYIGIGASAHSYDGKRTRRWNVSNLMQYIANEGNEYELETLNDDELFDEFVMLGLRQTQGIDLNKMSEKFGASKTAECLKEAEKFSANDWLKQEGHFIHVTHEGMKRLDFITAHLLS